MLEQTVAALRRQDGVHDWLVRHVRKTSQQYYVIGAQPECKRVVGSERVEVTVMNDHAPAQGSQSQARGEAEVIVLPGDLTHLPEKLDQATYMAQLTDNAPYGLPSASLYPTVDLADREMQDKPQQVVEQLVEQLLQTLTAEPHVRLSCAEVFVEQNHVQLENSRGARGRQVWTDLLLDWVLLASGHEDEMESHIAFERRRAVDLDIPALARRYAQYARDALAASPPKTGTYPVVVSDEALDELLMSAGYSPLIMRSSAQMKYYNMSSWSVGSSVFQQAPTGDPLTLYSNSLWPFGTRSECFDDEGLPGQRLSIIERGNLTRFWATQRFGEYLSIPPTGKFGNMELAAGSHSLADLYDDAEPLYHIVAFSAMSPDPMTGDFVGEIRLGYALHKGQVRPIRGGSISGNLFDALATAQLAQERVFLGDYYGPQAMRFPQIVVAGE